MKKFIKLVAVFAVMAAMLVTLAACKDDNVDPVGEWEFEKCTVKGNVSGLNIDISFDVDGLEDLSEEENEYAFLATLTFEFRADGTAISDITGGEVGYYKMDGNRIIPLEEEGGDEMDMEGMTLKIINGKLVMSGEMDGLQIKATFRKK